MKKKIVKDKPETTPKNVPEDLLTETWTFIPENTMPPGMESLENEKLLKKKAVEKPK